jgi:ribonucleoside-diphosphate reductase alpha chain
MPQYNDFRDLTVKPDEEGFATIQVEEDVSRIALCTLSAINLGNIRSLDDIEGWMWNAVRGLDQLLDYQDYLVPAAREATLDYRPLGIGIINLAYYFAKNNVTYDDPEAHQLIHDTMEAVQFYGIKASIELAKRKGPCRLYERTKYSQGLLPIDHYKKSVDEIVKPNYSLDWAWLREELKQHGMRNATITALMPAETSAKIVNATNGVEPVRSLVTVKGNKSNISKQVVPEIHRLKNKYQMLWDMEDMNGIIKTMAVIQKFTDQSISTNLSYNPAHYEGGKIPMSMMLRDLVLCARYGIKTLYYHNTRDGRDDDLQDHTEESKTEEPKWVAIPLNGPNGIEMVNVPAPIEVEDEEECESCTI